MEKSSIAGHTGGGGKRTPRETRVFVKKTFLQKFHKTKVF